MLKLTIKKGHAICIGDDIRIEFEPEYYKNKVHVKTKIFAPDEVPVKRLEIYEGKEEIEKDIKDYFRRVKSYKHKQTDSPRNSSAPIKQTVRHPYMLHQQSNYNNYYDKSDYSHDNVERNISQPKIIVKKKRMLSASESDSNAL
ncbi:carbon storage regulator [Zooshikella marina]|uniref:Carbon storage regulator n=1 Tax=Zooshikella ganghwensis TaxID=202772 RepID=A0A4P9VJY0_9GAMM|nr:carbon storage regulator [Zooshikella ganghwensis]MBU2706166.1 carbon storage regulator [Zooshikella ganghwensis]RDH42537.1 carbon storage regulator [Zooshikella ganghwensis]